MADDAGLGGWSEADLRGEVIRLRRLLNDKPIAQLTIEAIVTRDGGAAVLLAWGRERGQLTTEEAATYGLELVRAGTTADNLASLVAMLRDHDFSLVEVGQLLTELQQRLTGD